MTSCDSLESHREANSQDQEVPFTPINAAQVGLTWRSARRLMTSCSLGWDSDVDRDPMVAQSQQQQNNHR